MGLFDWIFEARYNSEKELLKDIREHANNWHNEITGSLSGLLVMWLANGNNIDAEKYAEIADELFRAKITANAGTSLWDVSVQMGNKSIPYFTSRDRLRGLIEAYLSSGDFVKKVGQNLRRWNDFNEQEKEQSKQRILRAWETFAGCREELVQEVNDYLRKLG